MPDAKHTPGPWNVITGPDHEPPDFSDLLIGVRPCGILAHVDPSNEMPSVADANARLIASAPDLLAAAEAALAGIEACLPQVARALAEELAKLRTAIARARGEE